jgi:hypothetical protein
VNEQTTMLGQVKDTLDEHARSLRHKVQQQRGWQSECKSRPCSLAYSN